MNSSIKNGKHVQEKMFELVEQCKKSSKSNRAFCQEQGIKESIFYYWHKKYRVQREAQNHFIPIKLNGKQGPSHGKIDILYPNGVKMTLPENIDIFKLKSLIGLK